MDFFADLRAPKVEDGSPRLHHLADDREENGIQRQDVDGVRILLTVLGRSITQSINQKIASILNFPYLE